MLASRAPHGALRAISHAFHLRASRAHGAHLCVVLLAHRIRKLLLRDGRLVNIFNTTTFFAQRIKNFLHNARHIDIGLCGAGRAKMAVVLA